MNYNYNDIDQPLYSRMIVGGESRYDVSFFNAHVGMFDRKGEMIEQVDTNMQNSSMIPNVFMIKGIRFRETEMDSRVRIHLLKYAHFVLRIVDRDYLTYSLHLMDNYYYFLEKRITPHIVINPHETFQVLLRMKPYDATFQLTCELLGLMRRLE